MCKNLFWDLLHSNFIFDHIENGKKKLKELSSKFWISTSNIITFKLIHR